MNILTIFTVGEKEEDLTKSILLLQITVAYITLACMLLQHICYFRNIKEVLLYLNYTLIIFKVF